MHVLPILASCIVVKGLGAIPAVKVFPYRIMSYEKDITLSIRPDSMILKGLVCWCLVCRNECCITLFVLIADVWQCAYVSLSAELYFVLSYLLTYSLI